MRSKPKIIFLSTFPPTQCGIATFTCDLFTMFKYLFSKSFDFKVVAVKRKDDFSRYGKDVLCKIVKEKREDYSRCAKFLNLQKNVVLINIQHEFGIFGGDYGEYLLDFLTILKKPAFVTFHSIIPKPKEKMLFITKKIASKVKKIVVMTERSKQILIRDYKIKSSKISVVPHGIHSFPFEKSQISKKKLKLTKRKVLLTFGLLSPNKGIEYVIESLPKVVKKFPETLYLVVGATHPVIKKNEGEKYREGLERKVKELSLTKNVKFINRYQDLDNLILFLKATDIYIATSIDVNQAVSGTFSYALGAGRPVVSTDFSQAREALSEKTGIMVPTKNSKEYERAILKLLKSEKKREKMGRIAYFKTRKMTWQNVSLSYFQIFARYLKKSQKIKTLPPINISHILKMTDNFGIIQFAKLSEPDKESGYTVDDNARAMLALSLYFKKGKDQKVLKYIKIYLSFLNFTLDKDGYFRNYVDKNRKFVKERNNTESPEDPTARALYALSRISSIKELPVEIRKKANSLFKKSLEKNIVFSHSRSIAFFVKALYFDFIQNKSDNIKKEIKKNADILFERFKKNNSPDWQWIEKFLAYSNGVLPESLFLAYRITGDEKYFQVALKSSRFLIKNSFSEKIFFPVGQKGWFFQGKEKSLFDQQPEEATSIVELTKLLCDITKKGLCHDYMYKAFRWFLGENALNQFVYDCATGGCYDGIGEKEINLNQGAESTISYLIARLTVEK